MMLPANKAEIKSPAYPHLFSLLLIGTSILIGHLFVLTNSRREQMGIQSGLQSYIDENTEVQEYQEVQIAARTYLVLISGY